MISAIPNRSTGGPLVRVGGEEQGLAGELAVVRGRQVLASRPREAHVGGGFFEGS